ncbi:aminomethyl transferase family protein [Saccharopolyspora sp. K220]|uniref:aminomethyl transferase family protein n=1 Tax=Saccharopolyspora soli TaxID=2926618 RepID=UPI001F565E18|nr:aminomethyl transferase family protein [Saccharopolyspora soli]MCI2419259.1 aminomethyl transferase family protein [Saccharopolyspora soli]
MPSESLEAKLARVGDAVRMLRDSPSNRFKFDYPEMYTNWQDEQRGWTQTATLFDQSHHMTDVYFEGPDVNRLLAETGTNSFKTWAPDKAKHFVACTDEGKMIGTAVLFGLESNRVNIVGPTATANWLQYHVETGDYDVEVVRDERTADQPAGGRRRMFRFEIEGPHTPKILEKVNSGPLEPVRFFGMTRFSIAGRPVRALAHTMAAVPGSQSTGYEIWGPVEDSEVCWNALLEAGEEFGLVLGGALAYYTAGVEAGYAAQPTPAIYSAPQLKSYREWLPGNGYEGKLSIGGSYTSDDIEDFYVSPFQFGYDHLVKFDHDFIGRDALKKLAQQPRRKKVWLRWHDEDVKRIYASSLFDGDNRAKYLETPLARYARVELDSILAGGRHVGVSTLRAYTVNVGCWLSVGFIEEDAAIDGAEVTIVWGEENGGTAKRSVESHVQTELRATVHTRPLPQR